MSPLSKCLDFCFNFYQRKKQLFIKGKPITSVHNLFSLNFTVSLFFRQKLEFIEAHRRLPQIPSILKKHGSLSYSFKDSPQLPVPLSKIKNRNKEVSLKVRRKMAFLLPCKYSWFSDKTISENVLEFVVAFINQKNPLIQQIEDGLRYLANENFPKDGKRFLQLVNLLRTENEINYSEVFDPYYSQPMYR